MTSPGVIFDVDGTLLDTNYLHVLAWWQAFRDAGREGIAMSTIHRAIGIGSEELVQRILGEPDEQAVEAHSERFAALRDQAVAFPGAAKLLRSCTGDLDLRVVLATSGAESDLEWMVPAIGVEDRVLAGTTTSGDVEGAKPRPDLLQVAIRDHDLDHDQTVAVGDTVWDVESAHRAGIPCIAVLCGGISRAELEAAGADAVYAEPADVLVELTKSPLGRLKG